MKLRYSLVLVNATNHSQIDYSSLAEWTPLIIDTRNAMNGIKVKEGQVWKA